MQRLHSLSALGNKQRGVATLLVSVVILALISFVTIYTSKTVLMEQKISNNDYKAKMAFEAAEAGLNQAINNLTTDPDLNNNNAVDGSSSGDPIFDTDNNTSRDSNQISVGFFNVVVTTNDLSGGEMSTIKITSTATLQDGTAKRTITRAIAKIDPIPNSPDNPLTTRGTAAFQGSGANVFNPQGHSTIWSGGAINMTAANTWVANPAHAPGADPILNPGYPACMEKVRECSVAQTSSNAVAGLDVVANDQNLNQLTNEEFFFNFFGMSKAKYKETMVNTTIDMASTTSAQAATQAEAASLEEKNIIWIEGDVTLNGGLYGCDTPINGTQFCPTNNTNPPIIIINGNAELRGGFHAYGIVYVSGNLDASGSSKIVGALMSAGNTANSGGSLEIHYDTSVLKKVNDNGPSGSSAGSWNDLG